MYQDSLLEAQIQVLLPCCCLQTCVISVSINSYLGTSVCKVSLLEDIPQASTHTIYKCLLPDTVSCLQTCNVCLNFYTNDGLHDMYKKVCSLVLLIFNGTALVL